MSLLENLLPGRVLCATLYRRSYSQSLRPSCNISSVWLPRAASCGVPVGVCYCFPLNVLLRDGAFIDDWHLVVTRIRTKSKLVFMVNPYFDLAQILNALLVIRYAGVILADCCC